MKRGARVLFLAGLLAGNPYFAANAGKGGTVGPGKDLTASVILGCVPQGGFLVQILFWIFDDDARDACLDLGDHPIGVWDATFFERHDYQVPGNHNGQLK